MKVGLLFHIIFIKLLDYFIFIIDNIFFCMMYFPKHLYITQYYLFCNFCLVFIFSFIFPLFLRYLSYSLSNVRCCFINFMYFVFVFILYVICMGYFARNPHTLWGRKVMIQNSRFTQWSIQRETTVSSV